VVVTHENAVYNAVAISHLLDTQAPQQLGLCWLPLYHDMGLVGNVLSVLYSRMPMMLMAPSTFLKRPDMFLRLVAQHRVTHVAAPNFAYELCARKLSDAAARQLDLSHLRVPTAPHSSQPTTSGNDFPNFALHCNGLLQVALNGAEQVQASTLRRFCDKFGPSGFTMDKFYACYGLAEATLIVTGGQQGVPPTFLASPASGAKEERVRPSDMLVACGTSLPEGEIRIVDPVSRTACPPLSVGEIWARGPGISPGYYGQPDRYSPHPA
jgi:acyl-CoA synthetase (AMP-forming)/AMP-acid ligase II